MWTRPRTLEELIRPDVKERWGIETDTPILWTTPTLSDAEREIADVNTIEIRYRTGIGRDTRLDQRLREVMKQNKIASVHSAEGNLQKLRTWAVSQGKKIRLIQEK